MRLRVPATIVVVTGAATALVVPGAAHRSHEQQQTLLGSPELLERPRIVYDVKRFHVNDSNAGLEIMKDAKVHDLDVWSTTSQSIDIYFPDGASMPPKLALRDHVDLAPSWIPPFGALDLTPAYPSIGTWNLTDIANCTFHNAYHSYAEITSFVQQLSEEYPDLVELVKIGRTAEDRDIIAVSISKRTRSKKKSKRRKRRIVIQGAQHAREWIASSTALYIAHALVVDAIRPQSKGPLDLMDFTIIPLPNPDGYAYTWSHDRLWYKNREDVHAGRCKGVDLNRNWGYEWQPSVDDDPCSHWYPGDRAFSSLESRAISSYIKRTPNIRAFLDLRSFGQIIMRPFSHSCDKKPKDEENLMEAALGAAKAMSKRHGIHVRTGSLCDELYRAPGNIVDWMYGAAGISVTYSVLLRDVGTFGFLLPPDQIRPVGEETSDMLAYLVKWIKVRHP